MYFVALMVKKLVILCSIKSVTKTAVSSQCSPSDLGAFSFQILAALIKEQIQSS